MVVMNFPASLEEDEASMAVVVCVWVGAREVRL